MLLKFKLLLVIAVATANAEAPHRSGPYPAAGWRPQRPFNLPGEYLPPAANQQQPQKVDVEISKERVEFAGQIQSNSLTTNQPQNAYLPPPDTFNESPDNEFLQVQGLPNKDRPYFLNKQQVLPQQKPQRGDQTSFGQRLEPRPLPQNVRPQVQQQNARPQEQPQQQFFPQEQALAKPAQQYGAPNAGQINIVYPDPRTLSASDDTDRTPIEALNAAVDAYNQAQLNRNAESDADDAEDGDDSGNSSSMSGYPYNPASGRFAQGQYYVLGPDNALQRVMFTTTQDEDEAKSNGFTAQLKYTPVGEIRDPVFKYNERGQLVRILKK